MIVNGHYEKKFMMMIMKIFSVPFHNPPKPPPKRRKKFMRMIVMDALAYHFKHKKLKKNSMVPSTPPSWRLGV